MLGSSRELVVKHRARIGPGWVFWHKCIADICTDSDFRAIKPIRKVSKRTHDKPVRTDEPQTFPMLLGDQDCRDSFILCGIKSLSVMIVFFFALCLWSSLDQTYFILLFSLSGYLKRTTHNEHCLIGINFGILFRNMKMLVPRFCER